MRKWDDDIKTYLKEIRLEDVSWINPTQGRDHWGALVNTVINFRVS
jgi:hypothetical protein